VANRASRAQGAALLRAAEVAFAAAAPLASRARAARLACHHAPVHGAVLAALGADADTARRLFLFATVRGVLAAAVRLGLAGPLEAQSLQARLAPELADALRACEAIGVEEAAAASPLVDLVQGHQDRLYSRLFQS
jgi:urease accessory protein